MNCTAGLRRFHGEVDIPTGPEPVEPLLGPAGRQPKASYPPIGFRPADPRLRPDSCGTGGIGFGKRNGVTTGRESEHSVSVVTPLGFHRTSPKKDRSDNRKRLRWKSQAKEAVVNHDDMRPDESGSKCDRRMYITVNENAAALPIETRLASFLEKLDLMIEVISSDAGLMGSQSIVGLMLLRDRLRAFESSGSITELDFESVDCAFDTMLISDRAVHFAWEVATDRVVEAALLERLRRADAEGTPDGQREKDKVEKVLASVRLDIRRLYDRWSIRKYTIESRNCDN